MEAHDPTTLLTEWREGNRAALDELFPLLYEELRRRAHAYLRGERKGHTLTTTALVHETYLKLLDVERVRWVDRPHFLALAATAMRRVLVDYARAHSASKRGGGSAGAALHSEFHNLGPVDAVNLPAERAELMLTLDAALEKLGRQDVRLARVVELRYFGGLTVEETAAALDLGERTVKQDWSKAKAWLYRELEET